MKTFFKPLRPQALFSFLSLMAGIIAGNGSPDNKIVAFWLIIAFAVLACLIRLSSKKNRFFILLGILFCFGYFSIQAKLFPDLPHHHISKVLDMKKTVITGRVVSFAQHYDRKSRITLLCQAMETENRTTQPITGRINLSIYGLSEKRPQFGDRIQFKASVKPARNFMNPGAFDYERFLQLKGVYGTAYTDIKNVEILTPLEPAGCVTRWLRQIETLRTSYYFFILNQTEYSNAGKILASLVTGKKELLSPRIRDGFSKAGISHLLAISGLHLSIVCLIFFAVFYRFFSFIPLLLISGGSRKLAGMFTLVPLTWYAVFTGFSPSTQRALIMISVLLFSYVSEKEKDIISSLSTAGLLILMMDAGALFSISFQLSFAAVSFIVCGASLIKRFSFNGKHNLLSRAVLLIWVTFFASLGTFPLTAHYFNMVSTIALLANLILIPVIGFIVLPLGLISLFCFLVLPPFSACIIHLSEQIILYSVMVSEFLISLPGSWSRIFTLDWFEIALIYLAFSAVFVWLKGRRKLSVILISLCLLMGIFLFLNSSFEKKSPPCLTITILDVGQGSSALIQTPAGKNILVDGGGFSDGSAFDTGRSIIAPLLWLKKIRALEYVVLSHPESDHLNGLNFILENFKVGTLIKNPDRKKTDNYVRLIETCNKKHVQIWEPSLAEEHLFSGDIKLLFYDALRPGSLFNFNNNSLVFKLVYHNFSMLFPGDILTDREKQLSRDAQIDLSSDILLSPHHGSSTSSSQIFLDKVQAKSVIVSCGRHNRYAFPHYAVLKRYTEMGIRIFRTDEDGAIFISSDGNDHHIKTSKGG